jgi:myo-inositol-1(or 4)-monophosphatase
MDFTRIKQIGTRAAYTGGKILNDHFGRSLQITKKGPIDLVTQADIASEKAIIATIREAFPDHAILAEESGTTNENRDDLWIVDPLDGTTNFAHGLPVYSISIAFVHHNEIVMGIVFNPQNGEFFSAVKGSGAFLNSHPIQVSSQRTVTDSLLVTGFPYLIRERTDTIMMRLTQCLKAAQGVRRLGSAALDLCYVSCGRFDGFWEEDLKPWDVAAGTLIVQEAGGRVSDFADRDYLPICRREHDEMLATNGHIHNQMIALMQLKDNQ